MATCPTCRAHYPDDVAHCAQDGDSLLPDEAFQGVDAELKPGDAVGEFRIEMKIGEGGFGTVYRAIHPLIGKKAALKTLHRQYSTNPQMVSRFIEEAKAVNKIHHRNIIDIFSFGSLPDGRQYYLMELLEGRPFDDYLRAKGRLTPEEALPIFRSVGRALDAAHAAGIAHRDLKPENIFLCFDEEGGVMPKLLDFGIAKLLTTTSGHKTRTGAPMGTPSYMSPEQCRGQNVDHRTDIYAFGALAFQVLTGTMAFDGEALMDILVKHMTVAPPRPSDKCPGLSPEFDAPILHMLAKEPEARPPTVGAAIEALYAAARRAGHNVGATGGEWKVPAAVGTSTPPVAGTPSLVNAKTALDGSLGRTLTPASSDVGPKPRGALIAVLAVLGVLGLGAGAFVVVHRYPGLVAGRTVQAVPPPTTTTSAAAATVAPTTSAPPPPAPDHPETVEVTVEGAPPHATVSWGATELGAAPGPFPIPYGKEAITLTVKAPGYKSQTVDYVPIASRPLKVTMVKAPSKPAVNKDLEIPNL